MGMERIDAPLVDIVQKIAERQQWTEARESDKKLKEVKKSTAVFLMSEIPYDKEPYTCELCGDICGYTRVQIPDVDKELYRFNRPRCRCEEAVYEFTMTNWKSHFKEDEEQRRRERRAQCRAASRLVGKLADMTLGNLMAFPFLGKAIEAARAYLTSWPTSRGLILCGPWGTGKTHIACAIGNALIERGVWVEFWAGFEILEAIRQSYDDNGEDPSKRLTEIDLLIYDDLGNERIARDDRGEWAREKLLRIFYQREIMELPVLVTTNYRWDDLKGSIGMPTMSRLIGMCGKPIKIDGPDFRTTEEGQADRRQATKEVEEEGRQTDEDINGFEDPFAETEE